MFTKNSKEPIKTWSNQWMIDNEYHYPYVVPIDFSKSEDEKKQLKLVKKDNKLSLHSPNYEKNQQELLSIIAHSKPKFNILVSRI